jgi:hypothetical protein
MFSKRRSQGTKKSMPLPTIEYQATIDILPPRSPICSLPHIPPSLLIGFQCILLRCLLLWVSYCEGWNILPVSRLGLAERSYSVIIPFFIYACVFDQ